MIGLLTSIFSGGGLKSLTDVATEYIQTDKESAEAKSLLIKVLDPNGLMRRQLSTFASIAYGYFLIVTSILLFMVAFNWGDAEGAAIAAGMMKDLFFPITTAWGAIVGASFGVNGMNSYKGK